MCKKLRYYIKSIKPYDAASFYTDNRICFGENSALKKTTIFIGKNDPKLQIHAYDVSYFYLLPE